jgi:hypothetical protein
VNPWTFTCSDLPFVGSMEVSQSSCYSSLYSLYCFMGENIELKNSRSVKTKL